MPFNQTLAPVPDEGDFMFVIDRSGTMDLAAEGTSASRWEELQTAMTATSPDWAALHLGLQTFPMLDGTSEVLNCGVSTSPDIALALGTTSNMLSGLVAAGPRAGETPTPDAITAVDAYLATVSSPRERFVVLITDGLPEPSCGASVDATVTAIGALHSQGVDTFVLGIVGPDGSGNTSGIPALRDGFNMLADAGGRARPGGIRFFEAVDAQTLTNGLAWVMASATNCQLELNEDPPGHQTLTVSLDGAGVPSGEYSINGSTVSFTGDACTTLQSGTVGTVTVSGTCN